MPEASDEKIGTYFTNGCRIPNYQREFAWSAALASQLFDSFDRFLISNPQLAGAAGASFIGPVAVAPGDINRFYLGSIITVDDNPIPIVDGQQRLTSVAIMASILRDYCIENGEYEQALELDKKFCWKVGRVGGRTNYSGGTPKVELRDTGTGNYNLQSNMTYICSLKLEPDPPITYEVTTKAPVGGRCNITIDEPLIWRLLEGHQLEINGANITVARTAGFGLPVFQVSNADAAHINVGDTFDLSYGSKIGTLPDKRTYIAKARNNLIEKISETLDDYYFGVGGPPPALHLPDLPTYVAQFIAMIEETDVTQIEFDDAGSAMEYFLVVNDKTLEKGLTDLDRLRAQIRIVIDGNHQVIGGAVIPNPVGLAPARLAGMADWQKLNKCMEQDFETIEEILLNRRGKDGAWSEDFFYDFYQVYCPLKGLAGDTRGPPPMTEIIQQHLRPMIDVDGNWNKVEFQKFTAEIRQFAGIYCRARDRWVVPRLAGAAVRYLSDVSNTDPFEPKPCERTEEVWTRILANMGTRKQFRPTYMAGSYVIRRAIEDGDIDGAEYRQLADTLCCSLLKMHIALQILPQSVQGGEPKTPGEIYGYSDQFVPTITAIPAGSVFADINVVFNAIRTRINGEIATYPPEDAAGLRLPIGINNPNAKPILMLAEWQQNAFVGATGAPLAPAAGHDFAAIHFHSGRENKPNEVEHIQPTALPAAYPVPPRREIDGYTALDEPTWIENNGRLGNRLLLRTEVNSHIKNWPLDYKIRNGVAGICPKIPVPAAGAPNRPGCSGVSKHYRGDGRGIVDKWLNADGVGGWLNTAPAPAMPTPPTLWGNAEIEKWEKEIIDLLVLILP